MAKIIGTSANEIITGTNGKDILKGKGGNDTIRGLGGHDTIKGGSGNDLIFGGSGNDILTAGTGRDVIKGGSGNDRITSSGYGDYFGGSGNDYMIAGLGTSDEQMNGGGGVDWLDTSLFSSSYTVNMVTGLTDWGETFLNFENILTGSGNDTITGTSDNNIILTGAGNDNVSAGAGNDKIDGGLGSDTLDGGAGFDTANYKNVTSGIFADLDVGKVYIGADTDTVSNIEKFKGSNNSDTFDSNTDAAYTFLGRGGNDTFIREEGTSSTYMHTFNGGKGVDTLSATGLLGAHTVDLSKGHIYYNTTVRDTLIDIENVTVTGGATVIGDGNDNRFVAYGSQSHTLKGNGGDDTIISGSGDDLLRGGKGNDSITGGFGDDIINGDKGNDTLTGGLDSDTFVFKGNFGKDRINDFNAFDADEKIDFSGVSGITGYNDLMNNHATQVGTNVVIKVGGNKVTLVNVDLNDLDSSDFLF